MGRLTNQIAELPMADFALSETAEIMRRTMEALSGASELPTAKIKVPAGGGKAFEMPGDDGADYAKSFDGVILAAAFANAYWDKPYGSGGDQAPLCASHDGISGWDADGMEHVCRTCPHNRMGSREGGRGKACRNMVELLILLEGQALPVLLRVPTMSVGNYAQYVARTLSPRGLQPWDVVTSFSLVGATNAGGIAYSQIAFSCKGRVDAAEAAQLRAAVQPMMLGAGTDNDKEDE